MEANVTSSSHRGTITVSIVSHGHGRMVGPLIKEVLGSDLVKGLILTLNIPEEDFDLPADQRLTVVRNDEPKGFGANHNAAFKFCTSPLFAVVNPDIHIETYVLSTLAQCVVESGAALVVPMVFGPDGAIEDSVREFPTPLSLFLKLLRLSDGRLQLPDTVDVLEVPWAAGMFMVFDNQAFARMEGFDEQYFLYYEDVDICTRLRQSGESIVLCGDAKVVHDAQRTSRKNLRYATWHLSSMLRFMLTHSWRLPRMPASSSPRAKDQG